MPDFHYAFHNHAAGCGGAGAPLAGAPNPLRITYPQLINGQLRLGVYPPGWVVDEIRWRVYSFCIGFQLAAAIGALPVVAPAVPVAQAVPVAGGAANLPPSPVSQGVDATEKGQIGYHLGTAVGGVLGTFLAIGGAARRWYAFHLTRAIANVYFGNFRVQVIDPPRKPRPPENVGPRNMDGFLRGYYAPFMEALGKNPTARRYDGISFQTVLLPKQIRLGLDSGIFNAMRSRSQVGALAAAVSQSSGYLNPKPNTAYVDPTGISVEVPNDWTPHQKGESFNGNRI